MLKINDQLKSKRNCKHNLYSLSIGIGTRVGGRVLLGEGGHGHPPVYIGTPQIGDRKMGTRVPIFIIF